MTHRQLELAEMPPFFEEKWRHVRQVMRVQRRVEHKNHCTFETLSLISNAPPGRFSAQEFLAFNRHHWACESHHWLRDVILREDASTIRSNHSPQNNAACNACALHLLKRFFGKVTEGSQRAAHSISKTIKLLV